MTGASCGSRVLPRIDTDRPTSGTRSLKTQRRYFAEYIGRTAGLGKRRRGCRRTKDLSGTSTRNRADRSVQMLAAAERGEIDLILTKEVSRFARNTVDTLAYTRRLRGTGWACCSSTTISIRAPERRRIPADDHGERGAGGKPQDLGAGQVGTAAVDGERRGVRCNSVYGYSRVPRRLTVKEEQAKVIRRCTASSSNDGKGTYVIARR